jgi:hypothetical protein
MATTRAKATAASGQPTELVCPECGKVFTRAQALGAHRRQAHGVAGTSKSAKASKASVASSNGRRRRGRPPGTAAASTGRARATPSRSTSARTSGNGGAVDRDALLRTLFPGGIPPQHDVMVAVNAWLEEAERLARRR